MRAMFARASIASVRNYCCASDPFRYTSAISKRNAALYSLQSAGAYGTRAFAPKDYGAHAKCAKMCVRRRTHHIDSYMYEAVVRALVRDLQTRSRAVPNRYYDLCVFDRISDIRCGGHTHKQHIRTRRRSFMAAARVTYAHACSTHTNTDVQAYHHICGPHSKQTFARHTYLQ